MNDKSVKVRNGAIDFWKFVFSILVVTPQNIDKRYENTAVGATMAGKRLMDRVIKAGGPPAQPLLQHKKIFSQLFLKQTRPPLRLVGAGCGDAECGSPCRCSGRRYYQAPGNCAAFYEGRGKQVRQQEISCLQQSERKDEETASTRSSTSFMVGVI